VPSVWPSLKTGYYIVLRRKVVNYFAFSFVTPLQPQYNVNHLISLLVSGKNNRLNDLLVIIFKQ